MAQAAETAEAECSQHKADLRSQLDAATQVGTCLALTETSEQVYNQFWRLQDSSSTLKYPKPWVWRCRARPCRHGSEHSNAGRHETLFGLARHGLAGAVCRFNTCDCFAQAAKDAGARAETAERSVAAAVRKTGI